MGAFALDRFNDRQQVLHRPGEPIELSDDEGVIVSQLLEGSAEFNALSHRRNLLAKYLLCAGGLQVAQLGFEPRLLVRGRSSRISYQHAEIPCLFEI